MMDNPDNPWNFHQCKICTYKTRFLHYILRHARQHMTRSKNHRFACNVHSPENHKCHKCPFRSDFKVLLKKHLDTVHRIKETQYYPTPLLKKCENCDFQTYSSLVLLSHDNRCVRSFPTIKDKTSLKLGKEKKHSNLQRDRPPLHAPLKKDAFFQCGYCSYKTTKNVYLKSHMRWKHTTSNQVDWFKCGNCSYKTKAKANLRVHMFKHIQPTEQKKSKRLECKQFYDNNCFDRNGNNIPATSNTSLESTKQLERQHYPRKAKLKNDLCDANLKDKNSVKLEKEKKHLNLQRGRSPLHTLLKKDGLFHCSYCSYKITRKQSLKTHMLCKHTPSDQINWFECKQCFFKSKFKFRLCQHVIAKHSDPAELDKHKKFKCDLCPYKSLRKDHLGKHIRVRHTSSSDQINWFKCEHCSFKTNRKYHLNRHLNNRHHLINLKIYWFQCKQCFFKSKFKFSLCQHVIAKHSDPAELEKHKKFKCDQCPYKSLRKDHLERHILYKHTPSDQINWFKCEHCSFKTKMKYLLIPHLNNRHLINPKNK